MLNPHFPALIQVQNHLCSVVGKDLFFFTLLLVYYTITISMPNKLHSLVLLVQTFAARTHLLPQSLINHFLCIQRESGTDSLNQGSTVIYPP